VSPNPLVRVTGSGLDSDSKTDYITEQLPDGGIYGAVQKEAGCY